MVRAIIEWNYLNADDAVYNASQAALGGGGGTLDKRGGLRDELGYIAPPNRKLPPVPGSNYNTCDRVKRQAVISEYSRTVSLILFLCLQVFLEFFINDFSLSWDLHRAYP